MQLSDGQNLLNLCIQCIMYDFLIIAVKQQQQQKWLIYFLKMEILKC